jgi:hypothetical protein
MIMGLGKRSLDGQGGFFMLQFRIVMAMVAFYGLGDSWKRASKTLP